MDKCLEDQRFIPIHHIITSKPKADPPRQQIYSPILETSSVARQIECPFCAEMISENAKKCKHCGEFLDLTLRAAAESRQSPIPPQIVMNVAGGSAHSTSVANADATAKSKAGLSPLSYTREFLDIPQRV